ncbi:uncharacterized protein BP5553_06408 [Venustampulla echinocandica]|uniref:Major facilitator superfamily (MFS) profile domain-containing protein n=1 Tax=Venustampulla echinocandica TaxID=2656787 RepID=A0A370TJU6_9HELO|nr:uncharacterized protein BP5553_06408 [Venustampulla echinocandica]RDL35796.1 hypothetical protein BP5553_06408 [Venustampulla echinocandica]
MVNTQHLEVEYTLPGTEILLTHEEGSSSEEGAVEKICLIPEPSDQPDDPLNWSPTWKAIVIVNQAIFVFISVLTPLSIAPLTPIFMQEFRITLPEVNMLFGAVAISLGYANFIIVPFSNVFGRRPTTLICGLVCVLTNVWQALATSYPSFIGARVISGLGAAANESIMPMVVADVMFLHQRGLWMGLYFWSYFIGNFIGPIISGSIAASISWRWFFWVCTILQAGNLLMMVALFPETRYHRPELSTPNSTSSTDVANEESKLEGPIPCETALKQGPRLETGDNVKIGTKHHESRHAHSHPATDHVKGRPAKHQFSLIPRPKIYGALRETLVRDILAPIEIISYPIILWAALSLGFASNCLLALNLTQSQVFAAPPYFFTPAQVGFVNFAFVVGGIIGLCTAGPVSDWVSILLAKRNKGVREAEMRLWVLIPYIAICLVGMTIAAVGYQRHWPWAVIVVVGYGFVGVEVVSIPAIVISYAVDCYKHIPGQIMVTATIAKNTFGFGMIFFFNDWAVRAGFIPPVMTLMALCVGFTLIGTIVFLKWGKSLRLRTRDSKLHSL